MKAEELLRIHEIAKEFNELYGRTGLVGINPGPEVQVTAETFFEEFGDREYEYTGNPPYRKVQCRTKDGVLYVAMLNFGVVQEVRE